MKYSYKRQFGGITDKYKLPIDLSNIKPIVPKSTYDNTRFTSNNINAFIAQGINDKKRYSDFSNNQTQISKQGVGASTATRKYIESKEANGRIDKKQEIANYIAMASLAVPVVGEAISGGIALGNAGIDAIQGDYTGSALNGLGYGLTKVPFNKLGAKYLPNAYKYNPLAKGNVLNKFDKNSFLRQVDEETYNEGLQSGFIKGKQNIDTDGGKGIISLNKTFGDDAYYNKGKLYYKDTDKVPYLYEVKKGEDAFIPKVNGRTKKYTTENTSIRVSKEPIPTNQAQVYKKDWIQGYKKIQSPTNNMAMSYEQNFNRMPRLSNDEKLKFVDEADDFIRINAGGRMFDDINSDEGRRRLLNQFKEADPSLDNEELLNLVNNRIESVKNTIKGNRAKWVKDVNKNLPNKKSKDDFLNDNDFDSFFPRNNAYHSNVSLYEENGFNLNLPSVLNSNSNKKNPFLINSNTQGHITLGQGFENSLPVLSHEVGHAIQKSGKMPLDDELRNIISSSVRGKFSLKGVADDLWRFYNNRNNSSFVSTDLDYYLNGSLGGEPTAFAREFREKILRDKVIGSTFEEITPSILKKAKINLKSLKEDRLLNLVPPWDYKKLSKSMNKLISTAPIGLGIAGVNKIEKKQTGGFSISNDNINSFIAQGIYNKKHI